MRSFGSLGIGLSLVFGVLLLLALVAELYYMLWWKKKISNEDFKGDYSSSKREFFYFLCWKKPSSMRSTTSNTESSQEEDIHIQLQSTSSKDLMLKTFPEDDIEAELKRLHNLSGPTRFLCTIKEESREDLESEDGKSRDGRSRRGSRGRSLSELFFKAESPFMTPLPSPRMYTPPLTPKDSYNNHGFNPLYESSTDAEMNRIRASPPPKFKFLIDAEEKLYRRKLFEEAERRLQQTGGVDNIQTSTTAAMVKNEETGPYITIIIDKNKDRDLHNHKHLDQHHSNSSQVLPLTSSPSAVGSPNLPLELQRHR